MTFLTDLDGRVFLTTDFFPDVLLADDNISVSKSSSLIRSSSSSVGGTLLVSDSGLRDDLLFPGAFRDLADFSSLNKSSLLFRTELFAVVNGKSSSLSSSEEYCKMTFLTDLDGRVFLTTDFFPDVLLADDKISVSKSSSLIRSSLSSVGGTLLVSDSGLRDDLLFPGAFRDLATWKCNHNSLTHRCSLHPLGLAKGLALLL